MSNYLFKRRDENARQPFKSATSMEWCLVLVFSQAAEKLANHFDTPDRPNLKLFPALFLYRHALELALKEIALFYANRQPVQCPEKISDCGHQLGKVVELIDEWARADLDDLADWNAVKKIVKQWERVDPTGMGFRYLRPKAKKGSTKVNCPSPLLIKDLEAFDIDLAGLAERMDFAVRYLWRFGEGLFWSAVLRSEDWESS